MKTVSFDGYGPMVKVGVSQMQMSHHHILSAGEGVDGNSQTYPWVNAVEFIVDQGIPGSSSYCN